jgi:UDP-glucose:(heptosyl)LPS alpha-1,3-glucosyltransferase
VIERFVPGAGGVENVAWQVAHELARQGDDVTILTRQSVANASRPRESSNDAGAAHPAAGSPNPKIQKVEVPTFWQPLRVTGFSRAVGRRVARQRFDVVHSFARTRHQDLYRAGGGSHADYLRRSHDALGSAIRRFSPRHRILLAIERGVFSDSEQRIQCASRLVADALVSGYGVDPARILLLPNAVDAARFDDPVATRTGARLRQELDGRAERIWLLPGSGWRRKGFATLLEAVAKLDDPGLRVWVAGRDAPGPWRRRIGALGLSRQIRFLGERSDLPAVYQAVDGMVLPTRYDPFANVTLEAAAAGLPIVTTASNGAAEWFGEDIRIVQDAEDAGALSREIEFFRGADRRRDFGGRAQQRARQLDWASHVSGLREEYQRIVQERSATGRLTSPTAATPT